MSPVEGIVLLSSSADEVCYADPQLDETAPTVLEAHTSAEPNGHAVASELSTPETEEQAVEAPSAAEEIAPPEKEEAAEETLEETLEESKAEVVKETKAETVEESKTEVAEEIIAEHAEETKAKVVEVRAAYLHRLHSIHL